MYRVKHAARNFSLSILAKVCTAPLFANRTPVLFRCQSRWAHPQGWVLAQVWQHIPVHFCFLILGRCVGKGSPVTPSLSFCWTLVMTHAPVMTLLTRKWQNTNLLRVVHETPGKNPSFWQHHRAAKLGQQLLPQDFLFFEKCKPLFT